MQAMLHIGRYLRMTKDKGLIYQPQAQSFDLWRDTDFGRYWPPRTRTFTHQLSGLPIAS